MEYLNQKDDSLSSKILFTGLDNAGKTSIILMLQREFSKFALLSPTRGAQRRVFEFLGKNISEWDLGGQQNYRISYLKNPDKYFEGTEIAIYVIDTMNKERHDEALSYLKDVIEKFKELEIEPPIFIFFHKFDPLLVKTSLNEMNTLVLNIKQKIKENIDYKKIMYYTTSIYDMSAIMKAMSEILLTLYSKAELLQKTLQEYANKTRARGAVILDDNSLIVGTFYENKKADDIIMATTPYFLALNDRLLKFTEEDSNDPKEDHMLIKRFGNYFIFKSIPIKEDKPDYYLLLLKDNAEFNDNYFLTFGNILREILNS